MNKQEMLTIIMPAYNEEQSVGQVIKSILEKKYPFVYEIILVDDGSPDHTAAIASQSGARVIRHRHNHGNANAIKTGIEASQTEFIMVFDADGQHKAEDIPRLWVKSAENDMVVGKRMGLIHSNLWRMPGKWMLWAMANLLVGRRIPDLNSGLRLMRKSVVIKYLHLCPSGFSFHITITMVMLCRDYEVEYVPITVEKRIGKSMVSVKTGLDTIVLIVRVATLFNPLRIFLPISGFLFILTLMRFLFDVRYLKYHPGQGLGGITVSLFIATLLVFLFGLLCDNISSLRKEIHE